jgi:hypothetical protein
VLRFSSSYFPCTDDTQCDHSKGDHSYADVVKFGDKHQNKHVGNHSYACTVEESGALHKQNNEKSTIPNPQIEQGDTQDCVIEEKIGSVALAEIHVFFSFVIGKLFSIYMQSPK